LKGLSFVFKQLGEEVFRK